MSKESEKKDAAALAKILAVLCVRNTMLEEFHCGIGPVTKTGDYSDVKVVHAEGEIPWTELSRISDPEMKALMKQVVNRLFTYFTMPSALHLGRQMSLWRGAAEKWDDPEIDELLLRTLEDYGSSASEDL